MKRNFLFSLILFFTFFINVKGQTVLPLVLDYPAYATGGPVQVTILKVSDADQRVLIRKRYLILKADMGEIYQLGETPWNASLSFTVSAQDNSSNELKSYSIQLPLSNHEPEKTYLLDYTVLEGRVSKFILTNITFAGAIPASNIKPRLIIDKTDDIAYHYFTKAGLEIRPGNLKATSILNAASNEVTSATFSWTLQSVNQNLPYFELEVLKAEPDANGKVKIDWSKASTIEIESDRVSKTTHPSGITQYNYSMVLSEGTGYYFWRVRAIGNYYAGDKGDYRNYGSWNLSSTLPGSVSSTSDALGVKTLLGLYAISASTYSASKINNLNTSSPIASDFFYYTQFEDQTNWIYSKVLTEGSRQSEKMIFANGLSQVKQEQVKLSSSNEVLATQNVYDFTGRGALKTLVAPINNSQFGYKDAFLNNATNEEYSAKDFDQDAYSPSPLSPASNPNQYYSNNNTVGVKADYVPNAAGFPFVRDLYYRDATGRVFKQGGPGEEMKLKDGADSRNIKTFYGAVTPEELFRVFGNEAPSDTTVYKVVTSDPNKVNSVQYIGRDGQILATCLSDANVTPNLEDIGNEQSFTISHTLEKNVITPGGNVSRESKTIVIDNDQQEVSIDYEIDVKKFCLACTSAASDCDYKVELEISNILTPADPSKNVLVRFNLFPSQVSANCSTSTNIKLSDVLPANISITSCGLAAHANFTSFVSNKKITLPQGIYTVEKRVYVNNADPSNIYQETFLDKKIKELVQQSQSWTKDVNCNCGPINVDLSDWTCDELYPGYCGPNNVNAIADFIANYIVQEQNSTVSSLVASMETSFPEESGNIPFTNISAFRNSEKVHSGTNSVKLNSGATGPSVNIPVREGETFNASVWSYYSGSRPNAFLVLSLFNASNQLINTITEQVPSNSSDKWNEVTAALRINLNGANAAGAYLKVSLVNNSPSASPVWFDNFNITGPEEGISVAYPSYKSRLKTQGSYLTGNQYMSGAVANITKIRTLVSTMLASDLTCKQIMDCFTMQGAFLLQNINTVSSGLSASFTTGPDGLPLTGAPRGYDSEYDFLKKAFDCLGYKELQLGLNEYFYNNFVYSNGAGGWIIRNNFNGLSPNYTGTAARVEHYFTNGVAPRAGINGQRYGMVLEGQLRVPADGSYTLYVTRDDGARVYLDGQNLTALENWNYALNGPFTLSQTIDLSEGFHDIRVEYFESEVGGQIKMEWAGPNLVRQVISNSYFFKPGTANVCQNYNSIHIYNSCTGALSTNTRALNVKIPCITYTQALTSAQQAEMPTLLKNKNCITATYIGDPYGTSLTPIPGYTEDQAREALCECLKQNQSTPPAGVSSAVIQTKILEECNKTCDQKRAMFEKAIDNYVEKVNNQNGIATPSDVGWVPFEGMPEFTGQTKACYVDIMVNQCKAQCNPESIFALDQAKIALGQTPASDPNYAAKMQEYNEYQAYLKSRVYFDRIQQDQLELEQALLYSAEFAPFKSNVSSGYLQTGDVKVVEDQVTSFIHQALMRGINYREVTASYTNKTFDYNPSPTYGTTSSSSSINYFINQQAKNFSMHIPDGKDGSGNPLYQDKSFSVVVNTIWKQSCPTGLTCTDAGDEHTDDKTNDELVEVNITFYCGLFQNALAGFSMRLDNTFLKSSYLNSAAAVDIKNDFLSTYFDAGGIFHIELAPSFKNAILTNGLNSDANTAIHFYQMTLNNYSGALFFNYSPTYDANRTTNDYLWLELVNPVTQERTRLFDEPLFWNLSYSDFPVGFHQMQRDIVDLINNAQSHNFKATYRENDFKIMLKASAKLVEFDPVDFSLIGSGSLPVTPSALVTEYNNKMQRPGAPYDQFAPTYIDPIREKVKSCATEVTIKSNCPYGYVPVGQVYSPATNTDFSLVGSAEIDKGRYVLTRDYDPYDDRAGAVWNKTKKNLTQPFTVDFELNFGCKDNNGADGITFVLQNSTAGLNALGGTFHGIGYGGRNQLIEYNPFTQVTETFPAQAGITPSLAVEFDTWDNSVSGSDPAGIVPSDISADHISIVINGQIYSATLPAGPVQASSTSVNIEDCQTHRAKIEWTGSPSNTLNIYFDGVLRLTYTNDIIANVFSGTNQVYWGWTASTGGSSNLQWVRPAPTPAACQACMRWYKKENFVPIADTKVTVLTCEYLQEQYEKNTIADKLDKCLQARISELRLNYENSCLKSVSDKLTLSYPVGYHHYTLYYYDRARNLFKTVPPEGVDLMTPAEVTSLINYRKNQTLPSGRLYPEHTLETTYEYNSIKQVISQFTPDGKTTSFWYNSIGQVILSQDAQQKADGKYSYTKYDPLSRIIETGEISGFTPAFTTDPIKRQIEDHIWLNSLNFPENVVPAVSKSEVIRTTYTAEASGITYNGQSQRNLRNRVSTVSKEDVKTYFSYDPHGNVEWIINDIPEIGKKSVRYEYDLISNKVNKVFYQEGKLEQFIHKYEYDEDNRITQVYTSKDNIVWEKEANYEYYLHGPLARTELGEDKIQGFDYVYTIEGYLKSMNQAELDPLKDPGHDGATNDFLKDEFAMELGYYDGDYTRSGKHIGKGSSTDPYLTGNLIKSDHSLFNGNITHWMTNTRAGSNAIYAADLKMNVYRYDKLNRIRSSDFRKFSGAAWQDQGNVFDEQFTYDANGNIETLTRYGYGSDPLMDQLQYSYHDVGGKRKENKLYHVKDLKVNSVYDDDIESDDDFIPAPSTINTANNYSYDLRGNLTADRSENISVTWNVYGKVTSVVKVDKVIEFVYDAMGNRIMKKITVNNRAERVTYYVRDASGNILAVYKKEFKNAENKTQYKLEEIPIYGSSRIGQYNADLLVGCYQGFIQGGPEDEEANLLLATEESQWLLGTSSGARILNFSPQGKQLTASFDGTGDYRNPSFVLDNNNKLLLGAYYSVSSASWVLIDKCRNRIAIPAGITLSASNETNASPVFVKNSADASKYYFIFPPSGSGYREWKYIEVNLNGNNGNGAISSPSVQNLAAGYSFGLGMTVIKDAGGNSRLYFYGQKDQVSKDIIIYSMDVNSSTITSPQVKAELKNNDNLTISANGEMTVSPDGRRIALALFVGSGTVSTTQDIATWEIDPFTGDLFNQKTWDVAGGNVQHLEYSSDSKFLYYTVTNGTSLAAKLGRVFVNSQSETVVLDNYDKIPYATRAGTAGSINYSFSNPAPVPVNSSPNSARYVRTNQPYDYIKYNTPVKTDVRGVTITLQVYDPNPPTNFLINAQNISQLNLSQWPKGIYAEYRATTSAAFANQWQTITFNNVSVKNGTTGDNVDQFVIHIDPNSSAKAGQIYLLDNFELKMNYPLVDNNGLVFYTIPGVNAADLSRTPDGKILLNSAGSFLTEVNAPNDMTLSVVNSSIQNNVLPLTGGVTYKNGFPKIQNNSSGLLAECGAPLVRSELNHWIVAAKGTTVHSGLIHLQYPSNGDPAVQLNPSTQPLNLSHNIAVAEDEAGNEKLRFYVGDVKDYNCPITITPSEFQGLKGEYYTSLSNGAIGTRAPTMTRMDATLDFNWGTGSPSSSINIHRFRVRWTGKLIVPTTSDYTFYLNSSKGARMYIDGNLLSNNNWNNANAQTNFPEERTNLVANLTEGIHDIVVEMFEEDLVAPYTGKNNASIQMFWSTPLMPKQIIPTQNLKYVNGSPVSLAYSKNGLVGQYYAGTPGLVPPLLTRIDPQINYAWQYGAPAAGMPIENFSVRWSGKVEAPVTGAYKFILNSDSPTDPLLIIDGAPVTTTGTPVTFKYPNNAQEYVFEKNISLTQGKHTIEILYVEAYGPATMKLSWEYPGQARIIIPSANLFPSDLTCDPLTPAHGLKAEYYNSYSPAQNEVTFMSSRTPNLTRTDNEVNFMWEYDSPSPGKYKEGVASDAYTLVRPLAAGVVDQNSFLVRWSGMIYIPKNADYTFYLKSDDGSKLFIDGTELTQLRFWGIQSPTERSQVKYLNEGMHDIELRYFEQGVGAQAILSWSSASIPKQVIPSGYLYTGETEYPFLATGGQQLDPTYEIKASAKTKAIFAKSPGEGNETYYLVTGKDGLLYSNRIRFTNGVAAIESKNQPLTGPDGATLSYDISRNRYALAVYNDVYQAGKNKLYVSVLNNKKISLYAYDIPSTGNFGNAVLVKEFKDNHCASGICGEIAAVDNKIDLGEMHISPKGDKLVMSIISGEGTVSSTNVASRLEVFGLTSTTDNIELSYDKSVILRTENRFVSAQTRVLTSKGEYQYAGKTMSFDFSGDGKYIYYMEQACDAGQIENCYYGTSCTDLNCRKSILKRVDIQNFTQPETVKQYYFDKIYETEMRRGANDKLYISYVPAVPAQSLLEVVTHHATLASVTVSNFNLGAGTNAYGLPLQPHVIYRRCNPSDQSKLFVRVVGKRVYELIDHLGNVRVVLQDNRKWMDAVGDGGNGDGMLSNNEMRTSVVNWSDYYAFGSEMPGRKSVGGNGEHRYGFNGKEKDDEFYDNSGNIYDFGARLFDSRLGRWLSIDPLAKEFAGRSPYEFSLSSPIKLNDPTGLKPNDPSTENSTSTAPILTNYEKNKSYGVMIILPKNLSDHNGVLQRQFDNAKKLGLPIMQVDNVAQFAEGLNMLKNDKVNVTTFSINQHSNWGWTRIGSQAVDRDTDFSSLKEGLSGKNVFLYTCLVTKDNNQKGKDLIQNFAKQTNSIVISSDHEIYEGYNYDGTSGGLNAYPEGRLGVTKQFPFIRYEEIEGDDYNDFHISKQGQTAYEIYDVNIKSNGTIIWNKEDDNYTNERVTYTAECPSGNCK